MANTFARLKNEYTELWHRIRIRPERTQEIEHVFRKLTSPANKARYQAVESTTGVPWYVVGLIHNLEASRRFDRHLHNGDPLTARTKNVPRNRPPTGTPPFTWEESAIDAIEFDKLANVQEWTLERIAFELEKFNGFGYRNHHPHVKSPYLWSFSNIYSRGKYIADGRWSENAVSAQCGAMTMLHYMIERGAVRLDSEGPPPEPEEMPPKPDTPAYPGYYLRDGVENDPNVEIIQRRLRELGIEPGPIDTDFGPLTEGAVRTFQARSADETGEPLEIDGIVGPITWRVLFTPGESQDPDTVPQPQPVPSSLTEVVLDLANEEVGIREQPPGSNRGPRVDEYIRTTGLNPTQDSYPWCMCFVFWCFVQATQRIGTPNLVPKNASVHGAWNKSQRRNGVTIILASAAQHNPALVEPGMTFFIDTGRGRGHTGIVAANINGRLETIEGNTNDNGSREGIGVFRRTRRRIEHINLGFAGYG